jgi:hypothetical protein
MLQKFSVPDKEKLRGCKTLIGKIMTAKSKNEKTTTFFTHYCCNVPRAGSVLACFWVEPSFAWALFSGPKVLRFCHPAPVRSVFHTYTSALNIYISCTTRGGQPGQDSQNRAARKGHPEGVNQIWQGRTGWAKKQVR